MSEEKLDKVEEERVNDVCLAYIVCVSWIGVVESGDSWDSVSQLLDTAEKALVDARAWVASKGKELPVLAKLGKQSEAFQEDVYSYAHSFLQKLRCKAELGDADDLLLSYYEKIHKQAEFSERFKRWYAAAPLRDSGESHETSVSEGAARVTHHEPLAGAGAGASKQKQKQKVRGKSASASGGHAWMGRRAAAGGGSKAAPTEEKKDAGHAPGGGSRLG